MTPKIHLWCWDRAARVCDLDPERGALKWRKVDPDHREPPDGFVKRCLWGPPLVVYSAVGTWYLQIRKQRWRLSDPALHIEAWPWGWFTKITVRIDRRRHTFIYAQPLDDLARRWDPTYDALDAAAADFPRWLAEKRKEARETAELSLLRLFPS